MAQGNQQRNRGRRGRDGDVKDEFDQVVLDLARVTRVMAGGKRMRFRAAVAVGDKKGRLGVGIAKGADVQLAISKATNDAKKKLVKIPMTDRKTIPHEIRVKSHSAQLYIKPAPSGTGVIAGSVVRQMLEIAGVTDVVAKIMGTGNKVNNAKTLLQALKSLRQARKKTTGPNASNKEVKEIKSETKIEKDKSEKSEKPKQDKAKS